MNTKSLFSGYSEPGLLKAFKQKKTLLTFLIHWVGIFLKTLLVIKNRARRLQFQWASNVTACRIRRNKLQPTCCQCSIRLSTSFMLSYGREELSRTETPDVWTNCWGMWLFNIWQIASWLALIRFLSTMDNQLHAHHPQTEKQLQWIMNNL